MDDTTDGITFERVTRTDLDDIVGLAQAAWYSPDGLGDLAAGHARRSRVGWRRARGGRPTACHRRGGVVSRGVHVGHEGPARWAGRRHHPHAGDACERRGVRVLGGCGAAGPRGRRAGCLPGPASARNARRSPASPSTSTRPGQQTRCAPRRALRISRACCCSSLARRPAATALGAGCLHGPETTSRATAPSATGSSRTRTATGPSTSTLGSSDSPSAPAPSRTRRALLRLWRARLEERGGASTKRRPRLLVRNPSCARARAAFFENDGLT